MTRHHRKALSAACTIGVASLSGSALAAPITFNTALPVADGQFILREQFFFIKSSDDPSSADRDLEIIGGISVLGYGATSDLALFGALPVLNKSLELDTPDGRRIERGDTGIGDVRLFGRYTAYRDDAPGRTLRVAPFAGLELPTGDDDERDRFGRLPQPLQLGSGSVDPAPGRLSTTRSTARRAIRSTPSRTTSSSATSCASTPRSSTACGRASSDPACRVFSTGSSRPT